MNFKLKRSHLITAIVILAAAAYITFAFPKQDFSVYYAAGRSLLSGRVDAHWSQALATGLLLTGAWLSVRASLRAAVTNR